ncbi:hypothetical protein D3C80_1238190 [compost metagenome]
MLINAEDVTPSATSDASCATSRKPLKVKTSELIHSLTLLGDGKLTAAGDSAMPCPPPDGFSAPSTARLPAKATRRGAAWSRMVRNAAKPCSSDRASNSLLPSAICMPSEAHNPQLTDCQ